MWNPSAQQPESEYTAGLSEEAQIELAELFPFLDDWLECASAVKPDWSRDALAEAWREMQALKRLKSALH